MFSRLREAASSSVFTNRSIPTKSTTILDDYVNEGWTTTTTTTPIIKATGLVLSILDVSCSMKNVKHCLSTSISACIKTMKVVAPGLDYAVITYTDFDSGSTRNRKPVIEAPDTKNWTGDDFVKYFDNSDVRGGGVMGCEALNSALWYALHDLVPTYKTRHNLIADFPVLIFVLTDEDLRLCDQDGRYGKVYRPDGSWKNRSPGIGRYTCTPDSFQECEEEIKLFKYRWGMETPATVTQFRDMLIKTNCWMRIVKYKGGESKGGIEELCAVDVAYGSANDRWQLFLSNESSSYCHYSNITRFMIMQQERFFKNVHYCLSSVAVLDKMTNSDLDNYVALGVLRTPVGVNEAQMRDFEARFMRPKDFDMEKYTSSGHCWSYDRMLLTSAYDQASSSTFLTIKTTEHQQQQQTSIDKAAMKLAGGGNVATCLIAHLKNDLTKRMVMNEIPDDERCGCKGCVKLYNAAQNDLRKQERYVMVQWARMFANMLFKPMTTDKAMVYACEAIPYEIGSIYEFVTKGISGICTEVGKILSEFQRSKNGDTEAYKSLRAGKSGKDVHYDASFVIDELIKRCSKKTDNSVDGGMIDENMEVDDKSVPSVNIGKNLVWVYIPSAENVQKEINSILSNASINQEEFKRFEKPQCFDVLKKIATSIKITRYTNEIPRTSCTRRGGRSAIRLGALPVIVDENDNKEATVNTWAEELFDGRVDVATLAYVPPCHAIQNLINLVDTGLGLSPKGFSGIKAVAAVASIAKSEEIPPELSTLLLTLALQALEDYVDSAEVLTAEEMFDRCLEGVAEGELENNLSNRTTLACFSQWMKHCKDVSPEKAYRLDHHLFTWALVKMDRNGIAKNYEQFAVRELIFEDKHGFFVCKNCKLKTLMEESFPGNTKLCVRCVVNDSAATAEFVKKTMGEEFVYRPAQQQNIAKPLSLNFANWKLSVTVKNKEEYTVNEKKLMLSNDCAVKKQAADVIIEQLEGGEEEITTAVAAEAVKYTNRVFGGNLLHNMISNGCVKIPPAVCVECSKCGIVYKTSPVTPAKKQHRRCPWCRITCKLVRCGKDGLELLTAINLKGSDGKITQAEMMWLLENLVRVGGTDKVGELTPENILAIQSYLEEMKEAKNAQGKAKGIRNASPDIFRRTIEMSTHNKISVIGHGPVKVGCENYMGGETYMLYDHLKWDDFNERVVLPVTGYILSNKWSSWQEFLYHGNKDEVWAFVGRMNREGQRGLKKLSNVASTTIADIDACVRHFAK